MKHESSLALFTAWDRWRAGAPLADPAAVQPADLGALLPHLVLLDLAEPDFRFRYCGVSLSTRYGRDLQNESFLSIWDRTDALAFGRLLAGMKTRRSGLVAGFLGETAGGGCTAFELILLPLGADNVCVSAIGSIVRTGGHDDANRLRARLASQSLVSVRVIEAARGPLRRPVPAPAAPVAGTAQFRSRYGHLTLVKGGRRGRSPALLTDH